MSKQLQNLRQENADQRRQLRDGLDVRAQEMSFWAVGKIIEGRQQYVGRFGYWVGLLKDAAAFLLASEAANTARASGGVVMQLNIQAIPVADPEIKKTLPEIKTAVKAIEP